MDAYARDVGQADVHVARPEVRAILAGDLVVAAVVVAVARLLAGEAGRLDLPLGRTRPATAAGAGLAQLPDLLLGRRRDLALALLLEHPLPLFPARLYLTQEMCTSLGDNMQVTFLFTFLPIKYEAET